MHVLISGRIRIDEINSKSQERQLFTDLSQCGDFVGEFSMFTEETHTKYAYAARDTELVKFSRTSWVEIIKSNPSSLKNIVKTFKRRRSQPESQPMKVIAIIQATPGSYLQEFNLRLISSLEKHGTVRKISGDEVRERFPSLPKK